MIDSKSDHMKDGVTGIWGRHDGRVAQPGCARSPNAQCPEPPDALCYEVGATDGFAISVSVALALLGVLLRS